MAVFRVAETAPGDDAPQITELVGVTDAAGARISPAKENGKLTEIAAALALLTGAGLTALPPVLVNVDDNEVELKAAVVGERVRIMGIIFSEIEAEVTELKFVDTEDDLVLHFTAFVTGGQVSLPPKMAAKFTLAMTSVGVGLKLVSTGARTVGVVYLATEEVA